MARANVGDGNNSSSIASARDVNKPLLVLANFGDGNNSLDAFLTPGGSKSAKDSGGPED